MSWGKHLSGRCEEVHGFAVVGSYLRRANELLSYTLGSPSAASNELIGLTLVVRSIIDWEGFSTHRR